MIDEHRWAEVRNFRELGIQVYQTDDIHYFIDKNGISPLKSSPYDTITCRVGNNLLAVSFGTYGEEGFLIDPITNKSSRKFNLPYRGCSAVVEFLNELWIIGGLKICNDRVLRTTKTVQTYNLHDRSHFISPVKMLHARDRHKAIVYDGKLFVFGGANNGVALNSVEMYSRETNKFVIMAPMKIARYNFACCRVKNLVYVIGGVNDSSNNYLETYLNSVEIYNLDTNRWGSGVDFPYCENIIFLNACPIEITE